MSLHALKKKALRKILERNDLQRHGVDSAARPCVLACGGKHCLRATTLGKRDLCAVAEILGDGKVLETRCQGECDHGPVVTLVVGGEATQLTKAKPEKLMAVAESLGNVAMATA